MERMGLGAPSRGLPMTSHERRVRVHSSWVLLCEILVTLLVFLGGYDFSKNMMDKYESKEYEFSSGVVDMLVLHFVLLFANTAAMCYLPLSDNYIYAIYGAHGVYMFLLLVKMSIFDWNAPAHALLPIIFISQIIRWTALWRLQNVFLSIAVARGLLWDRLSEDDIETAEGDKSQTRPVSLQELMRLLKPYFWPNAGADSALLNRVRSCATWVCVALSKAANVMAPLYLAKATNSLNHGRLTETYTNAVIYTVLLLASSVFKELQGLVYLKVKQQAYIEIAETTFAHLHALSLQWHLKKKMGNVMRSMDRGTEAANTLVSYLFLYLVPSILECIAVCIVFFLAYNQWQLSLLVLAGITAYAIVTVKVTMWRKKFREASNKHDNDYHDKATDSIINYETVKYFTNEQFEVQRFKDSVIEYQRNSVNTQASLSLLNISQQFLIRATLLGGMFMSGRAVINGELDVGAFVAINAYILGVFAPLSWLGTIYNGIITGIVDIQNLLHLLAEHPDVTDAPNAAPLRVPLRGGMDIEFRDVHFHYPEQPVHRGLQGVSFVVKPGTTTAIVGHTGAGKTTISRLLFRFYDPHRGQILLGGQDIKTVTQQSVRGAIGVVPQDTVMFNDTIMYNIRYGRMTASMHEVEQAAAASQIQNFIESLPDKWNAMVGERGLKLSGGEKQRVAIARCLLKNPPVVLLDEATSALDTITEQSVQEALKMLGKNRTTVIIAHRLSTIMHADEIIVLDQGRVAERGKHEELLAKGGQYAGLWNMQLRDPTAKAPDPNSAPALLDVNNENGADEVKINGN